MSKKSVNNEKIIAALIQHGTIKGAAEATGISSRTIYDRMTNDRDFQAEYSEAKNSLVRKAVFSITKKVSAAVEAVAEIMNDKEVNPAVRLQAAQALITNAAKFTERLNEYEANQRKVAADPFDFIKRIV